jgi:membrane protease YdiL (CAAX protease family)
MNKLILNKYFEVYLLVYLIASFLIIFFEKYPVNELIFIFLIVCVIFSSIAYFLSRSSQPLISEPAIQEGEYKVITGLILYLIICITWYKDFLNWILPEDVLSNPGSMSLIVILTKLIIFVFIPLIAYFRMYGFTLRDWGIILPLKEIINRKSIFIFLVMSIILLSFQYFFGNGARPVREGLITTSQLLFGLPLYYLVLVISVGIVEEFFFRTFLQSRLTVLLNSRTGGIVISALIFGLAHAPGIYLREGGALANLSKEPSLLLAIGYSISVLSVAGFFLAIIWDKTKNFWLIVCIHAMVDLLPGLNGFLETWNIK